MLSYDYVPQFARYACHSFSSWSSTVKSITRGYSTELVLHQSGSHCSTVKTQWVYDRRSRLGTSVDSRNKAVDRKTGLLLTPPVLQMLSLGSIKHKLIPSKAAKYYYIAIYYGTSPWCINLGLQGFPGEPVLLTTPARCLWFKAVVMQLNCDRSCAWNDWIDTTNR